MSNTPDENNSPVEDSKREVLENQCMDCMGTAADETLAKVLSYFPETAQLFIKTQEYATSVTGKKGLQYVVQLKVGDKYLAGGTCRVPGSEYLGISGYSGQNLMQKIKVIRVLRGEYELGLSADEVYGILDANDADDSDKEYVLIVKKMLEVMGVTDEELTLLREFYDAHRRSERMHRQATDLEDQAKKLREQAIAIVREIETDRIGGIYRARKSTEA
ncbi:MAG: hypothetical protein ABII07_02215 [Patescibacteria group bacterium]|nr:hypothetical protein [Patescibacteria group bacterium]